jgi:cytoskeletal protein RodZ
MKSDRANLQNIQADQLSEIAQVLRQTREEKGLSIEQVAKDTLIQRRLLQAIESVDLDQLPEMVYVRGFVKRYADVLGLDGQKLTEVLPVGPVNQTMKPSWKELPAAQLRPLHLYVLYIVLIASALWGLSYLFRRDQPAATTVQDVTNPPAEVEASPDPSATAEPAEPIQSATAGDEAADADAPESNLSAAEANKPIRVHIKLTSQSWMRITVDGETEFEGVLQPGDERTWTADEQLTLRAGNAGGVMVAFNNEDAEQLGEPGSVEEVTFPQSQNTAQLTDSEATLPR